MYERESCLSINWIHQYASGRELLPLVVNFFLVWGISSLCDELMPHVVKFWLLWWISYSCGEFLPRVVNFSLMWWIFFLMWWVSVLCGEKVKMSIGIYVVPEYRNNQFINVSFLWWIPSLCGEFRTGLRHEFPDLWIREIVPIVSTTCHRHTRNMLPASNT